jgi:hypothetical protein
MRHLIYILVLSIFVACSTKTTHSETGRVKFYNSIITDSILGKIPTITYSKFELNQDSNDNNEKKYTSLTQEQIDFFFTKEEQKKLSDYSEYRTYFIGKKKLGNEKLAIFLLCDAGYMGLSLYCAVIDSAGNLIGKFNPAYLELDAGYSIKGEGEFLNDSTYHFSEVNYEYIDSDHKITKRDSLIKIIEIKTKTLRTIQEIKFPTDTIIEN